MGFGPQSVSLAIFESDCEPSKQELRIRVWFQLKTFALKMQAHLAFHLPGGESVESSPKQPSARLI